jgi:hypothetical protein
MINPFQIILQGYLEKYEKIKKVKEEIKNSIFRVLELANYLKENITKENEFICIKLLNIEMTINFSCILLGSDEKSSSVYKGLIDWCYKIGKGDKEKEVIVLTDNFDEVGNINDGSDQIKQNIYENYILRRIISIIIKFYEDIGKQREAK